MIILELSYKQLQIIELIKSDVRKITSNDFSGHDFFHCERVLYIAALLQKKEGGNLFLIMVSSLLHDLDDKKLSPETFSDKLNARKILQKYDFAESEILSIINTIDTISFSGGKIPDTIEGKIVQDADRLDAIGAIGIARCFAYCGNNNIPIYTPDDFTGMSENSKSALMHFYNKLLKLSSKMNTESGKRAAQKRTLFIEQFLKQLLSEINCFDINFNGGKNGKEN